MSVREITARTLDLARTGDRVEAVFAERQEVAARLYKTLLADSAEKIAAAIMPLIVRVTAIPTMPQDIPDLTRRAELWWTGKGFSAVVDGTTYPCDYPARNFDQQPKVRLRSLVCVDDRSEGTSRLIRADGLVEFSLIHPRREPVRGSVSRIYVGWVISLVAGVVAQVERLRYRLAWDAVEYGLEIQVCSTPPPALFWNDDGFRDGYTMKAELPLTLPRYSLNSGDDFNGLITTIVRDLINSCGVNSETVCKVPWTELIKA